MSARAIEWAMGQRIASRSLKAALTTLASLADKNGVVFASQAAIAASLGVLDRQVRVHLSALEALGVIRRDRRNRANRGRTTDRITLAIGQNFDVSRADLSAAGYDIRKGKFSAAAGAGNRKALPVGKHRANREYISTGSAEPKTPQSVQGEKPADRRAKTGEAAASVEGSPPASKPAPHGTTSARRWSGSHYARQRATLDRLTRGTVH